MTIKEKIASLSKEINEQSDALNKAKLNCEREQKLFGKISNEALSIRLHVQTEWENSVKEYNKLRELVMKNEVDIHKR